MARIWQEGFESGFPHGDYLNGNDQINNNFIDGTNFNYATQRLKIGTGRNSFSLNSLQVTNTSFFTKFLDTSLDELYLRVYFNNQTTSNKAEVIKLTDSSGSLIFSIYNVSGATDTYQIRTRQSGTYASRHEFNLTSAQWYKIDIYLKISATLGAYEVKIDDTSIKSDSSLNLGSSNISQIGFGLGTTTFNGFILFDDIALNNTSGSINNSWCGSGTIVGLKPNGVGNSSEWDTCQGYAPAESGTNTTTIKVTGHGLSSNDVIYNVTRDAYRIITVTDANTFTVSTVTGQVTGDIIIGFANQDTISADTGTTSSALYLPGHNLETYDVFVNTSRSNTIRRVIWTNGNFIGFYSASADYQGAIFTQASGDSIKTFKVKPFTITNHYETCNNTKPNPNYSNIQTTTVNDIDLFDMEELTSDKGLPSTIAIRTVSHGIFAKEKGVGSNLKHVLRSSGANDEGSTIGLSDGSLQYNVIHEISPFTSIAWTRAEVDGLEAGVKAI